MRMGVTGQLTSRLQATQERARAMVGRDCYRREAVSNGRIACTDENLGRHPSRCAHECARARPWPSPRFGLGRNGGAVCAFSHPLAQAEVGYPERSFDVHA